MDCEFCKNTFKTLSSLNYHKTSAKYCLKLRNKVNDTLVCESCKKNFSSKHWLSMHKNKCMLNMQNSINKCNELIIENNNLKTVNEILENQVEDHKKTIKELQDKLENIAIKSVSRATTTNKTQINNYIQQLQPVTDDHFNDSAQYLTIEHILKGAEGYANFALQNSLQDRMLCVDYSRRKVKFKDKDGHIIVDPEMTELATKLFKSIKEKNKELILECIESLKENFGEEVDTIVKMCDYRIAVDKGSEGEKTDFHHDFVKQMCSKTIKE